MEKTTPVDTLKLIEEVAILTQGVESIQNWTHLHRCDAKVRLLLELGLINETTSGMLTEIITQTDDRMRNEAKAERDGGDS